MGRGDDGNAAMRQRVTAALGRARSRAACSPLRQRLSRNAMMPERSAASCSRRLATIGSVPTSPTTARMPGARNPSSIAHRISASRGVSASTTRPGSSPCAARPGPYRSGCGRHQSTMPFSFAMSRPRMPAIKAAASAPSSSSPPAPRISWRAPRAKPPPGNARSIAATAEGNTPCRVATGRSIPRMRSRSSERGALSTDAGMFHFCSDLLFCQRRLLTINKLAGSLRR